MLKRRRESGGAGRVSVVRRRVLWVIVALAIIGGAAYLSARPILTSIGNYLIEADPLRRVDAMIVLAPGMDRVVEAADLYRDGYTPIIVLTVEPRDPADQFLIDRGIPIEVNEQRRVRVLQTLGVPEDAIVMLPDVVLSTSDEAAAFSRWVAGRPIRSVMVVTSPSHTARSALTFRRALNGTGIEVRVHPSRLARFRADTWWQSRDTLRDGVIEFQKLLYYRVFERG